MENQNPIQPPMPVVPQNPIQEPTPSVIKTPQPIIPPTPEPVIQTPSEPSFEPKPKLSKWIIVAIIILALLIVGGTTAYFLNKNSISKTQTNSQTTAKQTPTPTSNATNATPDPTANWKTYDNKEWQISYPENLSTDIYQDGGVTFTSFTNVTPIPDSDGISSGMYLIITKYTKISSQSLKDYIDAYFKDSPPYIPPAQAITVDGISGLTTTYTSGMDGDHQTIFLPNPKNNGQVYYIEIYSGDSKEYKQIGAEILATFKFIDQTYPTPTCRPRPACLDATPRCLIPETSDMCPPTITPSP